MKIKVGDLVNQRGRVMRVVDTCDYDKEACWVDDEGIHEYTSVAKKLPIKFKEFEIYIGGCYARRTVDGITYVFTTDQEEARTSAYVYEVKKRMYPTKRVMFKKYLEQLQHEDFRTIDQAKDWLELQYATMIAKARGLV